MNKPGKRLRIYTVVDVWRGMAAGSRSFTRLKEARDYMRQIRKIRNLQEDDVRLFEDALQLA
jgi:hypothetical protein